jgi:DNA-binding CsgD family transcriptional regulator
MKDTTGSHEPHTTDTARLRPVERRVRHWVARGVDDAEIARRFGRGTRWVAQVRRLSDLDRPAGGPADDGPLRPLERRLLRWRQQGVDYEELSDRFQRSPEFLARVERYARYKLASA